MFSYKGINVKVLERKLLNTFGNLQAGFIRLNTVDLVLFCLIAEQHKRKIC